VIPKHPHVQRLNDADWKKVRLDEQKGTTGLARLSVHDPEHIAPFTASVIHSNRASNLRTLESEQRAFGNGKQALKKSNQSAAVCWLLW
jgi:hypothetical protein